MDDPKTYSQVSDEDIMTMVAEWDGEGTISRFLNVWLMEHGFAWDPAKTDERNREDFKQVAVRLLDALHP